jgi:agmatine/peptidylarginine deiminase
METRFSQGATRGLLLATTLALPVPRAAAMPPIDPNTPSRTRSSSLLRNRSPRRSESPRGTPDPCASLRTTFEKLTLTPPKQDIFESRAGSRSPSPLGIQYSDVSDASSDSDANLTRSERRSKHHTAVTLNPFAYAYEEFSPGKKKPAVAPASPRARAVAPRGPRIVAMPARHGIEGAEHNRAFNADLIKANRAILRNLPKGIQALVVNPPDELIREFAAEIASGKIKIVDEGTERANAWLQDYYPKAITGRRGEMEFIRFRYWEKEIPPGDRHLARSLQVRLNKSGLRAENSNLLIVDGKLYATNKVLRDNLIFSKKTIEKKLKNALHIKSGRWLPPLPGEPTQHLDIYANYLGKTKAGNKTILISSSHIPARQKMLDEVSQMFQQDGFTVVRVGNSEGPQDHVLTQPVKSYANSLILEDTAFVPTYDNPTQDKAAAEAYRKLGYKVVPIRCTEFVKRDGAIHCLTAKLYDDAQC